MNVSNLDGILSAANILVAKSILLKTDWRKLFIFGYFAFHIVT